VRTAWFDVSDPDGCVTSGELANDDAEVPDYAKRETVSDAAEQRLRPTRGLFVGGGD